VAHNVHFTFDMERRIAYKTNDDDKDDDDGGGGDEGVTTIICMCTLIFCHNIVTSESCHR